MRITQIRALKNGRFGLFSDDDFVLSLDADTLAESHIAAGDEIGPEALEALRGKVQQDRAREKALRLLTMRDHSREELRRKLERSVDADAAREVVGRMEDLGLVNDGEYAARYARELITRRNFGRRRAVLELCRRGIGKEMAEQAVAAVDGDPFRRAEQFLRAKYPQGLADEAARRRAGAALARRGFDWEDIRRAIENIEDEENAD